jgi:large subunit ribosomal protein L32
MVIRMRHTRAHSGNRRAHHALTPSQMVLCKECGHAKLPHRLCLNCGKYDGRVVIDVVAQAEKKEKKRKEKAAESK